MICLEGEFGGSLFGLRVVGQVLERTVDHCAGERQLHPISAADGHDLNVFPESRLRRAHLIGVEMLLHGENETLDLAERRIADAARGVVGKRAARAPLLVEELDQLSGARTHEARHNRVMALVERVQVLAQPAPS